MPPASTALRRAGHLAQCAVAVPLIGALAALPLPVAEGLLTGLAGVWFRLDRRRRAVAIANVLRSGVAHDERAAARIARASFRHFGLLVVESLKTPLWLRGDALARRIEVTLDPATQALLDEPGRGLILASGHYGNWEIAAQVLGRRKHVVGISRPLNNPYMDRWMQRFKPREGFELTPKHDANASRFTAAIAAGHVLAFMIDQHAGDRGLQVDFFGHPASTHTAVAMLHLVTRAPLFFGTCRRVGRMRFAMEAGPPIQIAPTGKREADVRAVLLQLNARLETAIRQDPTQYLWAHRRWRD